MPPAAADAIREILAVVIQAERENIGYDKACAFYTVQQALMTAGEAGWKAIKSQRPSELDRLAAYLDALHDASTTNAAPQPLDFDGRQRYLMDALRRLYEKGTDRVHLAELAGRLAVDCDLPEAEAEDLAKVYVRQFFEAGYLDYWQKPSRGMAMYGAEPTPCEFRILRAIRSVAAADTGADDPEGAANLTNAGACEAAGTASLTDLPKAATPADPAASPVDDPAASPPARKAKRSTERGEGRVKLIAALTKHHQYADGGCLNLEPIGNNELAHKATVDKATASAFFKKEFKGYGNYKVACADAARLTAALKLLNGEFAPHLLYGSKPADEDERDEE